MPVGWTGHPYRPGTGDAPPSSFSRWGESLFNQELRTKEGLFPQKKVCAPAQETEERSWAHWNDSYALYSPQMADEEDPASLSDPKLVPKKTQRSPPTSESTRGSSCEDECSPSLSNYKKWPREWLTLLGLFPCRFIPFPGLGIGHKRLQQWCSCWNALSLRFSRLNTLGVHSFNLLTEHWHRQNNNPSGPV